MNISLFELSMDTREAMQQFLREVYDDDCYVMQSWQEFDALAGLWYRLKAAEDTPTRFPKGKWATLQRLQELLDDYLQTERAANEKSP
jgi:hypothetical protein